MNPKFRGDREGEDAVRGMIFGLFLSLVLFLSAGIIWWGSVS